MRFDASQSPVKRASARHATDLPPRSTPVDLTADTLPPTPELTAPQASQASLGGHSISESDRDVRLSSRKRKKQKAKQERLDFAPSSPASKRAANNAQPVRAGFFGTQTYVDANSSGGSSDEEASLPKAPAPKKRKTRHSSPPVPEQSPDTRLASDNFVDLGEGGTASNDDEDEDVFPATPAARRRLKGLTNSLKPVSERASSPVLVHDDEDDDSDDVVITGSRKRQLSSKKRTLSVSQEEPSSDEGTAKRSRKRLRRTKEPTITEEERQEIEEDLKDLASSGSDTEVRLQRPRKQSGRKSAREQALAKLKAKREGGGTVAAEDETDGGDDDNESETFEEQIYQDIGNSDDPDGEDDDQFLPLPSSRQMFRKDEEDDSFIIEDDDADLGAPTGLPLQFTRYASMKPKELFKYAVEWMVQKKINPAFQMDDEIYHLAFKKLDDFVKGLAGSKFTSSAWTPDFTFAMQARPELQAFRLDRTGEHFMRDKCDACNRSGHPATFEVKFEGKPYNPQSLEEVTSTNDLPSDSESDSSSEDEANQQSNYDSKGRKILPEDTVFYLGKFCMKNAETAHALHHWRFHLYEWVVEYLEAAGYNTPANIVKRDKWSTHKRNKYSNKIVDAMHEDGKIKALYRDFQSQVNTARDSVQSGRWMSSP